MYERGASEEDMAAMGLSDDDIDDVIIPVFRDNWASVGVFEQMNTQWRTGYNGPTGLDYNVLPMIYRISKVPRKDQPLIFSDLRVMENVALNQMHAKD